MGIFGPDTRVIDGMVFEKQAEKENQFVAEAWARACQDKGYKVKVIPNPNRQVFEIWVCVGADPRVQQSTNNPNQGVK